VRIEGNKIKCLLIYRLQYTSDREIVFKLDSDLLVSERFEHGENELAGLVLVDAHRRCLLGAC
jgi:hypothetical protein